MADRRLQVFHSVATLLSFTKAAESLHMTQPAVTFQVRQLEEFYNTRLFDRTHNRITLTEAGRRVSEYALRIFDLYAEMNNTVKELTGEVSGILIIGASTTIAEYMLPTLLGRFRKEYPDVVVRLKISNTDGIVTMVENNVIDFGVVESVVSNKKLSVELCKKDQLVAIVPPDHVLASASSLPAKRLLDFPYICREEGSGTREVIGEYLQDAGLNPCELDVIMELGSPEAIKGAVEAGIGFSILSRATLAKEIRLGTLVAIPLEPRLERPFSFIRQKQKFRQCATEELLNFVREHCTNRLSMS